MAGSSKSRRLGIPGKNGRTNGFVFRTHSAALIAAKGSGTSLNQWAAKVLGEAAHA